MSININSIKMPSAADKQIIANSFREYDFCKAKAEEQQAKVNAIIEDELAKGEYFCEGDYVTRGGEPIKKGDRISKEWQTFLLSDASFHSLWDAVNPVLTAEGITDETGYYVEPWGERKVAAYWRLVNALVDHMVPANLRGGLEQCRHSVTYGDKLINIARPFCEKFILPNLY